MWPFRPKPPAILRNDAFWLTTEGRLRGLLTAAQNSRAAGARTLLITHFPHTRDDLSAALASASIPFESLDHPTTAPQLLTQLQSHSAPHIILALAGSLLPSPPRAPIVSLNPPIIDMLIAERYPLRASDDALVTFALSLSARSIQFHVSIKDPLMQAFSGEQTASILRTLGMSDNDSIDHPMLTRSIERAQQKIAKECPDPARVEAWLEERTRK